MWDVRSCLKSQNLDSKCPMRARPPGLRSSRNEFTVTWPVGNCNLSPGAPPAPLRFTNFYSPVFAQQTRRRLTFRKRLPGSTITFRLEWRERANFWCSFSRSSAIVCRRVGNAERSRGRSMPGILKIPRT